MSTEWMTYPTIDLTTAYGPVRASFTSSHHVAVHIDPTPLVYRGKEFGGMAHLYADGPDGAWSPRSRTDVTIAAKVPYGLGKDAPPTFRSAMLDAMRSALLGYVADNPDILRAADYAQAHRDLNGLEKEADELAGKLAAVRKDVRAAEAMRDANRPPTPDRAVITWANGFGVWHVRVSRGVTSPLLAARAALRDELALREAPREVYRSLWMHPRRVADLDDAQTMVYAEGPTEAEEQ